MYPKIPLLGKRRLVSGARVHSLSLSLAFFRRIELVRVAGDGGDMGGASSARSTDQEILAQPLLRL